MFNYIVFSTKLYAHQMFGSREFRTIFRVAPKSIWGPLQYTDYACNRKKQITGAWDIEERYGILFMTQRKRAGQKAC